jgi:hypothetical protein
MSPLLLTAAALIFGIGLAHSYLGEKYILIRLFRRDNLPRLFGGDQFTKQTLRFAWHLTTAAWWGFGAILWVLATADASPTDPLILRSISLVFATHCVVALAASRGRHLSWVVFGAVATLCWIAAG